MKTQQRLTHKIKTQDQIRLRKVRTLCESVLDDLFCVEVVGGEEEKRDFECMHRAGTDGEYYALICN